MTAAELTVKALKGMLDENELDLSMRQLETVPVKAISQIPRATHIDLSSNLLVQLPRELCQLDQIVKLDLSQNRLVHLPDEFGNLRNLAYLDLYKNRIEQLPLSFAQLKQLKWLDLKANPLEKDLAIAAGDCLDEKQCKAAACNVVQYVNELAIRNQRLREKQNKLQEKTVLAQTHVEGASGKEGTKKQKRKKASGNGEKDEGTMRATTQGNGQTGRSTEPMITEKSKKSNWCNGVWWCVSRAVLLSTLMALVCGSVIAFNCSTTTHFLPESRGLCSDLHSAFNQGRIPPSTSRNLQRTGIAIWKNAATNMKRLFTGINSKSISDTVSSIYYSAVTITLGIVEQITSFAVSMWDLFSQWYAREGGKFFASAWTNVKLAMRMLVAIVIDIADFLMGLPSPLSSHCGL